MFAYPLSAAPLFPGIVHSFLALLLFVIPVWLRMQVCGMVKYFTVELLTFHLDVLLNILLNEA